MPKKMGSSQDKSKREYDTPNKDFWK
jgi:hypothetical protein